MSTDIRIWQVNPASTDVIKLDLSTRFETEKLFEDVLEANPSMLMDQLTLVGRQVPAGAAGTIDLIGIDETDGRLVVIELKRGRLTRDAVAQVLDYTSYLETQSDSELEELVSEQSRLLSNRKFEDFQEWYANQAGDSLRPIRMVLVGIGTDPNAYRMVTYLAEHDVDICLLTFQGFLHGDSTLLARQVQTDRSTIRSSRSRPSLEAVLEQASAYGVEDLWQDARTALGICRQSRYIKMGITFAQQVITLAQGIRVAGSHSVSVAASGKIRITFYPAVLELCSERFDVLTSQIPSFKSERARHAPVTRDYSDQWYCDLKEEEWNKYKTNLKDFVQNLTNAWGNYEQVDLADSEES